jgi:LysM repeat protein
VDRICPFLTLGDDPRSAVDGFDPDHRCGAVAPSLALDRATQLQLCLHEGHAECPRFKAAAAVHTARRATPLPAPDATFASTRLLLEPDATWRGVALAGTSLKRPSRVALTGASVVLLVGAAAAAASTHGFGLLPANSVLTVRATDRPSPTPTPLASASPTTSPTPATTATPTATPRAATPSPAAHPTPRTYVVQSGDSLSSIAARFGVTVRALAAANNLDPNKVINIGQVLIIP